MTRIIFVTGTGTDVGKTVVTRGIVRALVNRNVNLGVLKPVESGVPVIDGVSQPHDAVALLRAARSDKPIAQTCRYMFKAPVSPHLAARLEKKTVQTGHIARFIDAAAQTCDVLIVEGAGGLLVPINDDTIYADFIATQKYELLIIAPDILGTINNTLLTIEAARHRGIFIRGVILNQGENQKLKNAEAISRFGNVPILGAFPILAALDDDNALADAAAHHLNLDLIAF